VLSRKKVSVLLVTYNEKRNLADCLAGLSWADEIVVMDTGSSDGTAELAASLGARVHRIPWKGFGDAKARGLAECGGEWVFSIDADERVSPELAEEIVSVVSQISGPAGYFVNRLTYFLGRPIKHCGWHPDYVLRLFKRDKASIEPRLVHEAFAVRGKTGRLGSLLLHHSDPDLEHYVKKMNRYTTLSAAEAHCPARWCLCRLLLRPPVTFFRMYFLKRGFLDGLEGFVLSFLSSVHVFLKYAKVLEREKGRAEAEEEILRR